MTQEEKDSAYDKFVSEDKFAQFVYSRESFMAGIEAFVNWQIKLREQRIESPNVEEYYKYIVNPEQATINVAPNFEGVSQQDAFEHIEVKMVHHKEVRTPSLFEIPKRPTKGIAVDVGCKGNPGKAEYRGVDLETGEVVFHVQIPHLSTNNIGEFLGAVAGLKWALEKKDKEYKVWSDSMTAISWVRQRKCKTKFVVHDVDQQSMIADAENFLRQFGGKIMFWDKKAFKQEIPADFGRK